MWIIFFLGLLILASIGVLFGARIAAIIVLALTGLSILFVLIVVQDGYNREQAYRQSITPPPGTFKLNSAAPQGNGYLPIIPTSSFQQVPDPPQPSISNVIDCSTQSNTYFNGQKCIDQNSF